MLRQWRSWPCFGYWILGQVRYTRIDGNRCWNLSLPAWHDGSCFQQQQFSFSFVVFFLFSICNLKTADGTPAKFPAEKDRYVMYVIAGCPFAARPWMIMGKWHDVQYVRKCLHKEGRKERFVWQRKCLPWCRSGCIPYLRTILLTPIFHSKTTTNPCFQYRVLWPRGIDSRRETLPRKLWRWLVLSSHFRRRKRPGSNVSRRSSRSRSSPQRDNHTFERIIQ